MKKSEKQREAREEKVIKKGIERGGQSIGQEKGLREKEEKQRAAERNWETI